jgi:hypothetical protein
MRSVLVAIDLVKETDGSFKVLELNTGLAITPISVEPYFNKTDFDTLISENEITEIDLVLLDVGPVFANNTDYPDDTLFGFGSYFDKYYSGLTINKSVVKMRNQVMPTIEDSPNKLIIRQCYDSTALIDETYAKDNFEFLKLLYDGSPSSIAKTYFNHPSLGIDMIGDTLRDNGPHPNYIIKERFPTRNYSIYPKVFKIDTVEELQDLKINLPSNTLLQEYVINTDDLEQGKIKTYRTINLLYGSELNIVNLIDPFIHTNACSVDATVDVIDNEIEIWERPKYLQKYNNSLGDLEYNCDSTNLILGLDGTLLSPDQLNVNDTIKTINLLGLSDGDDEMTIYKYSGNTEEVFTGSTFSSATIIGLTTTNKNVWLRNITLEDGLKFSDIDGSKVLVKRNDLLIFTSFHEIISTDEIVVVNKDTNQFETKQIISDSYIFSNETIYSIDVEDIDIYLTMDESSSNPEYFMIQHNKPICRCWFPFFAPGSWNCFDPCYPPEGIYTGTHYEECLNLGLPPFYCIELICCKAEPLVDDGGTPVFNQDCMECTYSKQDF